jgi:hypothetical protein
MGQKLKIAGWLSVGALAGAALVAMARQTVIVDRLGRVDRSVDDAVDALAIHVSDFSSGFASVIAGVLQPGPTAQRMVRNGELVGQLVGLGAFAARQAAPARRSRRSS